MLESFGGHPMACGMSIDIDKIDEFRKLLNKNSSLSQKDKQRSINIDQAIDISKLSLEFAQALNKLEPFGKDFERPIFADKNVQISNIGLIGKEKNTLRMTLSKNGVNINAIKFNAASDYKALSEKFKQNIIGQNIDIVYYPDINEFRGNTSLQLKIIDFR